MILRSVFLIAVFLSVLNSCPAQSDAASRAMNEPVKPYRVIGNIYYVGASDVTSFLITTPNGHILLDSGFIETVPQIKQNVAQLGFRLEDIKILLNSHAHYDHAGGFAELKRLTGAKLMTSERRRCATRRGWQRRSEFRRPIPVRTGQTRSHPARRRQSRTWRRNNDRPHDSRSHERLHQLDHES
jgi:metallo-beta-lactamase class B